MEPQFDQFLQELINQRFIQKGYFVEPEIIEELKRDIIRQLDEFIMSRVINALSDDDVLSLEAMMNQEKPLEELQSFAAEHIRDFTTFLTNVLLEFQQVYLRN